MTNSPVGDVLEQEAKHGAAVGVGLFGSAVEDRVAAGQMRREYGSP